MAIPATAKKVFEGVLFDVFQWPEQGYDGSTMVFEGLKRADTATVIAIGADGLAYYAEQEQPGRAPFISMFGGRIENGEDPLEAAKRELLEESGLASDNWQLLYQMPQTAGRIEHTAYFYVARNCQKVAEQNLDAGEKIMVKSCTPQQLVTEVIAHPAFRDSVLRGLIHSAFNPQKANELLSKIS
ncbi:MAG TPA: NUDIX hydrolase [Alphaproteobacteria bacterium]|nr:NUDIX hydrolase [Alphaproteobacteria bacterium]